MNFPGDSDCDQGVVWNDGTHVCSNCQGHGCEPKRTKRGIQARRTAKLMSLSGATIVPDQKGRAVYVNLENNTAFVSED